MTEQECNLIEFAQKLGAEARRTVIDSKSRVFVSVEFTGLKGVRKHAIFVNESETRASWIVHFSRYAVTREISDCELKQILQKWIKQPDDQLFRSYVTTENK